MTEPKIIPAVKGTRPHYSHTEAEELMAIVLASGHPRAEHLVGKLVTAAEQPGPYIRTLERVRAAVTLNSGGPSEPLAPAALQKLVLDRFPHANRFHLVGSPAYYRCEGVVFCLGRRDWRFAAPDGHVSMVDCPSPDAAREAFEGYMQAKEKSSNAP